MELKNYCFPLKEPNSLILEIFLVSKSEKVEPFKLQFEPILAVMQGNKSSSFFPDFLCLIRSPTENPLTFPRDCPMLRFWLTLPLNHRGRPYRLLSQKSSTLRKKNPLNFVYLSVNIILINILF